MILVLHLSHKHGLHYQVRHLQKGWLTGRAAAQAVLKGEKTEPTQQVFQPVDSRAYSNVSKLSLFVQEPFSEAESLSLTSMVPLPTIDTHKMHTNPSRALLFISTAHTKDGHQRSQRATVSNWTTAPLMMPAESPFSLLFHLHSGTAKQSIYSMEDKLYLPAYLLFHFFASGPKLESFFTLMHSTP